MYAGPLKRDYAGTAGYVIRGDTAKRHMEPPVQIQKQRALRHDSFSFLPRLCAVLAATVFIAVLGQSLTMQP